MLLDYYLFCVDGVFLDADVVFGKEGAGVLEVGLALGALGGVEVFGRITGGQHAVVVLAGGDGATPSRAYSRSR